jgi:hypothetical protein
MGHVVVVFRDPPSRNNRTTAPAGDSPHIDKEQTIVNQVDTF